MNPRFVYTGQYKYEPLTAVTQPDGPRVYHTPYGPANSVTTILSLLPAPALDAWIERVGREEAERIRDEAAVIGTCMHNRLEAYVKGVEYTPIDSPLEQTADLLFMTVRSSCLGALTEVWGVEEALYLYDLIAGRTDVMGIYAGKRSIIDYKTGLRTKTDDVMDKYKIQTCLYAVCHDWMFEDFPGYQPLEQGVILVGIRPSERNPARVQKVLFSGDEFTHYKHKAIGVIEDFHAGRLGQIPLNTQMVEDVDR